ncbi:hypothetical protein BSKO_05485 [Bryopsis sp. KO-2023]|nr:hypothetical protein BSKO_05485 [Bryopsis sp. KO-2023]
MPEKRGLENGSGREEAKRSKVAPAKGAGGALSIKEKLMALQNKIKSNPKLMALKSAKEAAQKGGQRDPLPPQVSIYAAARNTASALEAAARGSNPSIATRFASGPAAGGLSQTSQLQGSQLPPKPESSKFFDPHMGVVQSRHSRTRKNFWFLDEAKIEKEAELERFRAKYGNEAAMRLQTGRIFGLKGVRKEDIKRYLDAGKKNDSKPDPTKMEGLGDPEQDDMDVGDESEVEEPPEDIPDIEWWDQALLVHGTYDDVREETSNIKPDRITIYIQHPVPIEPPAENAPPPPQPLKLTKAEMKKLRSQRRQQREKEKQELIRQGLLEPPKPKVKISNMMRVLAEEAAADPTAVEREVRKAMEERQQAHEDRNLARKLTPEERKEKKLRKLFDDGGVDFQTCVFKVLDLSNMQFKYKVTINAEENRMTGVCLITDAFSLVVVEGCPKSIKRYKKLMLRRIKWKKSEDQEEEEAEGKNAAGNSAGVKAKTSNACYLVWEGLLKKPFFSDFQTQEIAGENAAKRFLEKCHVKNYWDLAKGYDVDRANAEESQIV